jgi:hypothetical protein
VVVGKEKEFDRALATAGLPVERVDITIPPPPSGGPSNAPEGSAPAGDAGLGRQWLERAADAAGGAAAWKAVKTVRLEQSSTVTMHDRSMSANSTLLWRLPDHIASVRVLPFGESKLGYDGKNGWSALGKQVKDEPDLGE